jgi:hypothetical protein
MSPRRVPLRSKPRTSRWPTETDRAAFLEALEAGWSVTHAAARTTFARQRFYELRDQDEAFATAWAEAWEAGTDRLEDELRSRAVDGYHEDTLNGKGEIIRRVLRKDLPGLYRTLAARRPERWSTTGRVEVTGPDGEPIAVDHRAGLTLDQLAGFVVGLRSTQRPDQPLSPALEQMTERAAIGPAAPNGNHNERERES